MIKELESSALTMPFRFGWGEGWTVGEVQNIIGNNEYSAEVVDEAGGIQTWITLTNGGRRNPSDWPFKLPVWPKPKPEDDPFFEPINRPSTELDPINAAAPAKAPIEKVLEALAALQSDVTEIKDEIGVLLGGNQ